MVQTREQCFLILDENIAILMGCFQYQYIFELDNLDAAVVVNFCLAFPDAHRTRFESETCPSCHPSPFSNALLTLNDVRSGTHFASLSRRYSILRTHRLRVPGQADSQRSALLLQRRPYISRLRYGASVLPFSRLLVFGLTYRRAQGSLEVLMGSAIEYIVRLL